MTRHPGFPRFFLLFALCCACSARAFPGENNPIANSKSTLTVDSCRFTVLTPSLIRLEWAADGRFEDRPSLVFINRNLPVPKFSTSFDGDRFILETDAVRLRYKLGSGKLSPENVEIAYTSADSRRTWNPGLKDTANLGGTIRTLDGVRGPIPLDPGLLSRDGWVFVDDSNSPLFDSNIIIPSTDKAWPWVVARPSGERQDWYFFGYGHNYKQALGDFVRVAGRTPMPPKYAFGAWWSRYWRYTDEEIRGLVHEFHRYDVPLDVYVIDMDWHLTFDLRWGKRVLDQAGQMLGWTGYTWDKVLFPDPPGLLGWLHKNNFQVTLNLHPASGVQPYEEMYPRMAKAMGVDPSAKQYIPFTITDKEFARNYFDIVLRPLERQGVDFWWIDWQQWDTTAVPGLNPTWWLNYTFYTDMERQNRGRPIILARWGGLGSHRHQIGFSGDVITDWSSLDFQTYFTSTAANVGFGYWSHDIGGHIPGTVSPELYTRWVQWGAFSPALRTHTTKNADAERRIWAYPPDYYQTMREAFMLRHQLLPYVYTSSHDSYVSGVSLCHPLYYECPEFDEAYSFRNQYFFGDAMMIAPVTTPLDSESLLARKTVWIPPGTWVEWYSGNRYVGPATVERTFSLDEIPFYVRAGSIIPMQSVNQDNQNASIDPLVLSIFPADSGSATVYEDDGNSSAYTGNESAHTPVNFRRRGNRTLSVDIGPTTGHFKGMSERRRYELRLVGTWSAKIVTVDDRALGAFDDNNNVGYRYDGNTLTTIVTLPPVEIGKKLHVEVEFSGAIDSPLLIGVPGILHRLTSTTAILNHLWPKDWSPDELIEAAQTGTRLTLAATNGKPLEDELSELRNLKDILPQIPEFLRSLDGDQQIVKRALSHVRSIIP